MSLAASLIDLKAELSKKREESKSGRDPQVNIKGGHKWKLLADKIDVKNKVKQLKAQKGRTSDEGERKAIDEEIEKELRVSREALERKAAIYESRMGKAMEGIFQESDEEADEDKICLVNFDEKAMEQIKIRNEERRQAEGRLRGYKRKEDENDSDDSDDWVEFTDSLGRTRRCLRKDLKFFIAADKDLKKEDSSEPQSTGIKKFKLIDSESDEEDETKEEVKTKGPVHYTDVRFNEVRDHGVGFYQFSSDSGERAKQLDELNQLREQTVKQIKVKAKEKEKKSKAIEQRLARIAARRGIKLESKSNEIKSDSDDD